MAEIKNYTLNFGPQHPAAHGVLRLVLELDGEVIQRADPHIGLLHRATEKLAESKTYMQSLPYMDRLDYVSMMCNEHAYCLAIERLLGIEVPERAQYIRVMFAEITRLLNHLLWLGAHGLDCGAMNVLIYCFREREDLFDMYEAVSGARMHAAYFRPGGVYRDLPDSMPQYKVSRIKNQKAIDALNDTRSGSLLDFIESFTRRFPGYVDEYETLLTDNRIWKQRTVGIGVVLARAGDEPGLFRADAARLGHRMGPAQEAALRRLRAHGFRHPRRHARRHLRPLPGAHRGDAAEQPHHQAVRRLAACQPRSGDHRQPQGGGAVACGHEGPHGGTDPPLQALHRRIHVPEGEAYAAVEHPKGEFGIYLDQRRRQQALPAEDPPAPGFPHLAALDEMARGHMLADAVAIIGTMDIVFGEVDR